MQIRCALVGMPGSGKSTVGRQLAHRAGVPFIDLDHWLEKTIGTTIRSFFETEGEARFRDLEAQALAEITQQPGGMVLSTGGGAVLRPENREVLRQFGNVLYLRAWPEEIFKRVKHDKTRPLLQGGNSMGSCATCTPNATPVPGNRALRHRDRAAVGGTLVNMVMQLEMAQSAVVAAPSTRHRAAL